MPCEYSQAQYDDFQWEQVRIHPGTRAPADLPHGEPLVSFRGGSARLLCDLELVTKLSGLVCFSICNGTCDAERGALGHRLCMSGCFVGRMGAGLSDQRPLWLQVTTHFLLFPLAQGRPHSQQVLVTSP